jgi:hypothetical protein
MVDPGARITTAAQDHCRPESLPPRVIETPLEP